MEEYNQREYNRKIKIKKYYEKWLDYQKLKAQGANWFNTLDQYIPINKGLDYVFTYIIVLMATQPNPSKSLLYGVVIFFGWKVIYEIFQVVGGIIHKKLNLYKIEADWGTKNKDYNTYSIESMETMENIAKAVGAESKFTHL